MSRCQELREITCTKHTPPCGPNQTDFQFTLLHLSQLYSFSREGEMSSLPLSICSRCREQSVARMMVIIRGQTAILKYMPQSPLPSYAPQRSKHLFYSYRYCWHYCVSFITCIMYSVHFQAPCYILLSFSHSAEPPPLPIKSFSYLHGLLSLFSLTCDPLRLIRFAFVIENGGGGDLLKHEWFTNGYTNEENDSRSLSIW